MGHLTGEERSLQFIWAAVVCSVKKEKGMKIYCREELRGISTCIHYFSHRLETALTICSEDLLKGHRRMLVHHVTLVIGIFKILITFS